jgi:hypothetical protein
LCYVVQYLNKPEWTLERVSAAHKARPAMKSCIFSGSRPEMFSRVKKIP